jgi:hypothetical protein
VNEEPFSVNSSKFKKSHNYVPVQVVQEINSFWIDKCSCVSDICNEISKLNILVLVLVLALVSCIIYQYLVSIFCVNLSLVV